MLFTTEVKAKALAFGLHSTVAWYKLKTPLTTTEFSKELLSQNTQGNVMVLLRDRDDKGDYLIVYYADTAITATRAVIETLWDPRRYSLVFHNETQVATRKDRLVVHNAVDEKLRYFEPVIEGKLRWPYITAPLTAVELLPNEALQGYRSYDVEVVVGEFDKMSDEKRLEVELELANKETEKVNRWNSNPMLPRNEYESQFALTLKRPDGIVYTLPEYVNPRSLSKVKGADDALAALQAANEVEVTKPKRKGARTSKRPGKI